MPNPMPPPIAAPFPWSEFCDVDCPEAVTSRSWVRKGWRYCTDGRIALRAPAPGEPDTDTREWCPKGNPPNVRDVFEMQQGLDQCRLFPLPDRSHCPNRCRGTGIAPQSKVCDECDGTGGPDCPHCHEHIKCEYCNGTGRYKWSEECAACRPHYTVRLTPETILAPRYVAKLVGLGVPAVWHDGTRDAPARFSIDIDGQPGEGLLMPAAAADQGDAPCAAKSS